MKFHNEEVAEFVAEGLWRRHGKSALEIVSQFETDPELAQIGFEGAEFTLGELLYIAKEESVVDLEDLLRRRTPIALIRRKSEIDQNKYLSRVVAVFN
jgi:alpha-glycerophosphate oxidase/glycerol-3-phosphate dehydrogenase